MPRDYKSRSRYEPESSGPSKFVWLFVGILIGMIMSGLFYLKSNHPSPVMIDRHAPPPAKTEKPKKAKSDQQKNSQDNAQNQNSQNSQNLQTQFDFYNVLPKNQNQAPVSANPQTQPSPAPQPLVPTQQALQATQTTSSTPSTTPANTTTPSSPVATAPITQSTPLTTSTTSTPTVSTRNYVVQIATMSKPADADKLKAQLLLLGFDVNVTPVQKNGQTMQRVWVGPFTTKSDAKATQQQLSQNQISSKLLKSAS